MTDKLYLTDLEAGRLHLTDLRSITRDSDICLTTVGVRLGPSWDRGADREWLKFGRCRIRKMERDSGLPEWELAAHLGQGATDFEHDSAFALRLPLVGLKYKFTENHQSLFVAMIDIGRDDDFHVPLPDYDPFAHPETGPCPRCRGVEAHLMVPEGLYVPPHIPELFKLVAGKIVQIYIGQPHSRG